MKNKELLRKKYRILRQELSDETVRRKSEEMCRRLIELLDNKDVRSLHVFLPIVADNEPDLRVFIEYALRRDIEVFVSYPPSGKAVQEVAGQDQLKNYMLQDAGHLDMIIVPMLAYDLETHHRLGYGGGFYDRLLAKRQHSQAIGVCFSECTAKLPIEPHDEPLDQIICI